MRPKTNIDKDIQAKDRKGGVRPASASCTTDKHSSKCVGDRMDKARPECAMSNTGAAGPNRARLCDEMADPDSVTSAAGGEEREAARTAPTMKAEESHCTRLRVKAELPVFT